MRLSLVLLSTVSFALIESRSTYGVHPERRDGQINLAHNTVPPPPAPESIDVSELPLPPVAPNSFEGSCTTSINPHGTGCINQTTNLQSGSFTIDGNHVTSMVEFVGSSNDSVYLGIQVILIKADSTLFPNGDPWKCLTCGVSRKNTRGTTPDFSYPQAFKDGKRLLAGSNIIDCGKHDLTSNKCTPSELHIYPIHWTISSDPSTPSGSMRELRIHPDDTHLAWSSFTKAGQLCYLARLIFIPSSLSPTTNHTTPPHYTLTNINLLLSPTNLPPLQTHGSNLTIHPNSIAIGEIRGFSGTGTELTYLGYPRESNNIDVFAINLLTGAIRRLTSHPEYVDPVDISPDDTWHVVMDTRGSNRQMFFSALRGIPPITDILSTPVVASTRNNGQRRFFQPYLIDRFGDREGYFGQRVNGAGDEKPGSVNDENWNGLADPKWSPDGTRVVYHQGLVVAPACGDANPLPCPKSTADGGRTKRIMVARLTSRSPVPKQRIIPAPDIVPWATPYEHDQHLPNTQLNPLREGTYTLTNSLSGSAIVTISNTSSPSSCPSDLSSTPQISVSYTAYTSPDFPNLLLNGTESVSVTRGNTPATYRLTYHANLTQQDTLQHTTNRKLTSENGFHLTIDVLENVFMARGWLVSVVGGVVFRQPGNGM